MMLLFIEQVMRTLVVPEWFFRIFRECRYIYLYAVFNPDKILSLYSNGVDLNLNVVVPRARGSLYIANFIHFNNIKK